MPGLLYKRNELLGVGDVHRFKVTLKTKEDDLGKQVHVKVKNNENILLASAYLNGPYILYADVRPQDWDSQTQYFSTNDQPHFEPNVNPGQTMNHSFTLNRIQDQYEWSIDVMSQIVFSTSAKTSFEISIYLGDDSEGAGAKDGNYSDGRLIVEHMTTLDLWCKPPRSATDPIHLIVLTHGLHSNATADMCYIRDQLERNSQHTGENIVIRGYSGNVCKTERGVKYLGRRMAEFVVGDALEGLDRSQIKKISFIGHSLGGLVQTFALAYINVNYPTFFEEIKPENFITMASPLLGISNENPAYVKLCLSLGIVGKSGHDMNLQGDKPLLMLLPSNPTRQVLRMFKRRTVYANVVNDGIVPLRTSALLYLDWRGLSNVYKALREGGNPETEPGDDTTACEIPNDMTSQMDSVEEEKSPSILNSLRDKVQTTIGFCLPNLGAERSMPKKYRYFQAQDEEDDEDDSTEEESVLAIPKSNVITSIKRVILPPLPTSSFINDPSSRHESIIHDRIYKPSMIPPATRNMPPTNILAQLDIAKRHRYLEEKIARRWHDGMSWRKVLVVLEPDAHNNIVVRRRFSNAYGWQAVDNLIKNHFTKAHIDNEDASEWEIEKETHAEPDEYGKRLDKVLEKEFHKEHPEGHKAIEKAPGELKHDDGPRSPPHSDIDDSWLEEGAEEYYDGPTGMINTVGESVVESVEAVRRGVMGLGAEVAPLEPPQGVVAGYL